MAELDLFAELKTLTTALDQLQLGYAVCGAIAVGVHGAPRATKDLDFLVDPRSLTAIKEVARSLGFVLEALPMKFRSSNTVVHRISKLVDGDLLTLDFLVANEETQPIFDDRQRVEYEGGSFWVVSKRGLIAMKIAAGRNQDKFDLERLQDEE